MCLQTIYGKGSHLLLWAGSWASGGKNNKTGNVEDSWNVMAHAQKPDFVFRRNGRVHLNRRGRQFSRLLAAKACPSAVVMLDTPCSEIVWRVLATHSTRQFPVHFPSRESPCAITFQLESTYSVTFRRLRGTVVEGEKAGSITQPECICSLRYPACNAHAPYCHQWPDPLYNIFPHFPTNGTIFGGKKNCYWTQNMCFDFLYNFCLKHFSFWEEMGEIWLEMYIYRSSCKVPFNLVWF